MTLKFKSERKSKEGINRTYYRDRYNSLKIWEVVKFQGGGFLLRQYIHNKISNTYNQIGASSRVTKAWLKELGILEFEKLKGGEIAC